MLYDNTYNVVLFTISENHIIFLQKTYRRHIKHECNGMTTYRLVPATPKNIMMKKPNTDGDVDLTAQRVKKVGPSRIRRSANAVEAHADNNYLEFAGKYIQYNIVNLKEIE